MWLWEKSLTHHVFVSFHYCVVVVIVKNNIQVKESDDVLFRDGDNGVNIPIDQKVNICQKQVKKKKKIDLKK